MNRLGYFAVAAGGPVPLTIGTGVERTSGTNASSYSFTSTSLGAEPGVGQRRYIAVFLNTMGNNTAGNSTIPNYVRVGGVDMTNIIFQYDAGNGGTACSLWYLEVTTGTTATITISLPGASGRCGCVVWPVYSDADGIAVRQSTSSTLTTANVGPTSVVAGDVVISGAAALASGSAPSISGGYMTLEGSGLVENTSYHAWAKLEAGANASSPTVTWSIPGVPDSNAAVLAVIKPALAT